jgi:hypothetical protein
MVVDAEVAAAARDVEPRIGCDIDAPQRGEVVAVEFADRLHQVRQAEIAQLTNDRLGPREQVEVAFEQLGISNCVRVRIRVARALGFAREEQLA